VRSGERQDGRVARRDDARRITVGVADEHELFCRGIVACLVEDGDFAVHTIDEGRVLPALDVAVLSSHAADHLRLRCPLVICDTPAARGRHPRAFSVLDRRTTTAAQLCATVRAAAAGLRVEAPLNGVLAIDPRGRRLLELLADGHNTREIAARLAYSERTIKKQIAELEHHFEVRSRAQLVAVAVRDGHI
jgi:DNA-binding CsgD family transcriptional regulator